jgi:1-aminocyclopropane-1-carboxylate deaminase
MKLPRINLNEIDWLLADGSTFHFTIARLDELHPVVSGNKYFKLKYNLQKTIDEGKKGIITMGGAYSNHLAAAAFACNENGLKSTAIVRGEIQEPLNETLQFCREMNMQFISVNRKEFNRQSITVENILAENTDFFFVPEGGDNEEGIKGCMEILSLIDHADSFSHIFCCIGTGTTYKGILASAKTRQTIIGIPVLKIREEEKLEFIVKHTYIESTADNSVLFDFAGAGYARHNQQQLNFMNLFNNKTGIPTDIVYTGKLMQAVITLAQQKYFKLNSNILVIHSGGLQGNNSLKQDELCF